MRTLDTITDILSPTIARSVVKLLASIQESTESALRVFRAFLKQKTRLRTFPRRVKRAFIFSLVNLYQTELGI